MNRVLYAFSFLLFFGSNALLAQKGSFKVMKRPDIFDVPVDKAGFAESGYKAFSNEIWIVYADRDDAYTLKDLKKKEKFKELTFKDWFYVVEEKDKYVHIAKASQSNQDGQKITNAEDFGWIEKNKMLLWSTGLLDFDTQINKKAFLLNKARDIKAILKQEKKEDVAIYTSPIAKNTIGNKSIYEFYFVMKEEGNYVLLSKNVTINSRTIQENLIGWVRKSKLVFWDTRIALEPNFSEAAFEERRNNADFRLRAYGTQNNADQHAKSGKAVNAVDDVIWQDDPVIRSRTDLARTNPNRWPGAVVRLPMLNTFENYYRTGLVGDITTKTFSDFLDTINEVNYANIEGAMNVKDEKRHNYNIFYVIEGTQSMATHKEAILRAMDEMYGALNQVENIRFGAAIYRDSDEAKEGKLFEIQELTTSAQEVLAFVQNSQFRRWHDNDEYCAMYYGLNRSLLEAGFNTNHTNIVFLIGNNADFSSERVRKKAATDSGDEALVSRGEITDKLSELDVHLLTLQIDNKDDLPSKFFNRQARALIQQNAQKQYQYYVDICEDVPSLGCENPEMPDLDAGSRIDLANGAVKQRMVKPNAGSRLSTGDVRDEMVNAAKDINGFVEAYFDLVNSMINDGNSFDDLTSLSSGSGSSSSVSAGVLAPAFAKELKRLKDRKTGQWRTDDIKRLVDEKYQLYTEVFVPRTMSGATHNPFSFVLYMPQDDLERYIRILERVVEAADAPEEEKREMVQNALIELVDQFTGGSSLTKGNNISIDQLRNLMQGVKDEGLSLGGSDENFIISDIKNERKVDKAKLEAFVTRIHGVVKELRKISRTKNYEFSYKSGEDIYYWIPVEDTF